MAPRAGLLVRIFTWRSDGTVHTLIPQSCFSWTFLPCNKTERADQFKWAVGEPGTLCRRLRPARYQGQCNLYIECSWFLNSRL